MKKILCAALAWLLCLPIFPVCPAKAENPVFQTYFYDDFFTGYQPGDTTIKGGYENTLGKLSRREDGDNGYMRLVNVDKNLSGANFKKDLTPYIEGKPKLVLEFRYQPNLNNSASLYKDLAGNTETFCIQRAAPRGYKDKENGTVLEDFLLPTYLTEWHTVTIVYDNEKETRTIFINNNKYADVEGNSYAKTGKFVWSGYLSNKIDGHFDVDYVSLYEYQEQFDFKIENAGNTQTDRISVEFNFPVKPETVTPERFSIDANRVQEIQRDPINPRKYSLIFETPLENGSDYMLQAQGMLDINERQANASHEFHTKDESQYLDNLEIEDFTLGQSGSYKIKANAVNETENPIDASVFVTSYDETNTMCSLKIGSITIPPKSDGAVETSVLLDEDKAQQRCELFAVQSLETLSPLSGKTTYDSNGMTQKGLLRDCGTYEGEVTVAYTPDFENQQIIPKITVDDIQPRNGIFVVLKKEEPISKENIAFADFYTLENGEAELPVKLSGGGTFFGLTSVYKAAAVQRSQFEFFGLDYIAKALPALNAAADKVGIEQFFNDFAKACSIDMLPYEALSESGKEYILKAILDTKADLGGSYASIEAFQTRLSGLYQLAAFYYQNAGMKELVETFSDRLEDAVLELYQDDLSSVAVQAVDIEMKGPLCSTEKSFLEAFKKAAILTGIEKAEHYKQTRKILSGCSQIIGISESLMEQYNGLRQKENVDQKLTGVRFASFDRLIQTFSEETEKQRIKEQAPSDGGGSGSGGASSRPGSNQGQITLIPNVPDKDAPDPFEKPTQTAPPAVKPDNGYPYTDMENARWARSAVRYLHLKKVVQGKSEGKFAPEDAVTRAEFVAMAGKAFGLKEKADGSNPFSDVAADAWYNDIVTAAYESGIVSGMEDGHFSPEERITREMAAVILFRLGNPGKYDGTKAGFTDQERISPYAAEAVGKLSAKGIIGGYEDGTFRPDGYLTRAEAAMLIFRLLTAV